MPVRLIHRLLVLKILKLRAWYQKISQMVRQGNFITYRR